MGKHFQQNSKSSNKTIISDDKIYGKIIARQGEDLIVAQNKIKELEDKLVQERADRIEELRNINVLATCNTYNNEKIFLHKIAEVVNDKIKELTTIKANKKELSSHTDQSI